LRNPLSRLLSPFDRKSWSVASPDFPLSLFGGAPTTAGPTVNTTTAMRVAPLNAAVRLISTACGLTPAKVFTRDPKAPARDHAAYRLVNGFTNEWMSAGEFREKVTADAMLHGHGYARAIRAGSGDTVQEFHRIDQRHKPVQRKFRSDGEPYYIVGSGAAAIELPFTDMLHVPGFYDTSIIEAGKEAIGLAAYLETKAAKFVAKHAQPSGIVFFEKDQIKKRRVNGELVEESQLPRLREAWDQALAADSSGTLFIDNAAGARYQGVDTPSAQAAELVAQREFQIAEISRLTGVPPTMLSSLGRATWSNVEQLGLQFRQDALRPWLRRWEDAYALVLLTPEERDDFFVEFVLDDLAAADVATQAEAFAKYRAMEAMTANEVRAVRNLPAHADGDTLANPNTTSGAPDTP
ncbi:MAG: phage portal protein, partial [Vicinamibacterales bacterium]